MNRGMQLLAVGGIVGVALSVSLAGELMTERRTTPTSPIKSSRPGRLEFFSRGGKSADAETESLAENESEINLDAASTAPLRYVRQKGTPIESNIQTNKSVAKRLEQELFGDDLTTSKKKSADREILQTGFEASPTQSSKRVKRNLPELDDGHLIVPADFKQKPGENARVQSVPTEQRQMTPATATAAVNRPQKTNRVSIINGKSAKPIASSVSQTTRDATTSERSGVKNPSETAGTPTVSVEWTNHGEINVGQECACDLLVKNTSRVPARQVVVEAFFPASVRLTQAEPQPRHTADHLEWSFAELPAGEDRVIRIRMIPSQRGELATTANVRFTGTAASIFKVAEPLLKVTVDAPQEVVVGDPHVQTITVTNPGTGAAQNVRLRVTTPDGLEHTRGDRSLIDIGTLSPQESRTVRLSFTAIGGGKQTVTVEAAADSGLKQAAESTVNVIAPSLQLAIDGPSLRYVGRDARYTLTITNDGQAATNNVRVSHRLTKGFKFIKADKGGTLDAKQDSVNWFVGHLEPEQSVQLKLQLQVSELGDFEQHVQATSEHGVIAKANMRTKVEGSAELVMEIQDLDDPVEIGHETVYEIRVSNHGSKAAEKVGLTFELPSGLRLINVQSATEHMSKSGLILFDDLPQLAPGKTALYRIHVRGETEGNQRVRARLTSESIDQELISEELTKFYAD